MSSFRRRFVKRPIPGTKTSPQTGQVITSSGNPSLDTILGGGLPIGSICLIEEDQFVTYSKVLAKYFMAEGVLSKQSIFLGSLDDTPKEFIRKLPQHCTVPAEDESPETGKNSLRIAWRYNDLPMVNSEQTPEEIGHNFNLMEFMDPNLLEHVQTITWSDDPSENDNVVNEDGCDLKDPSYDYETDATCLMDSSREIDQENSKNSATPNPLLYLDDKSEATEDNNTNAIDSSKETGLESSTYGATPNPLLYFHNTSEVTEANNSDAANVINSNKEIEMEKSNNNAIPNPLLCLDDKTETADDNTITAMDCSKEMESSKNNATPNPLLYFDNKLEANEDKNINAIYSRKEFEMENSKNNATPNPLIYLDDKMETSEDKIVTGPETETLGSSFLSTPPSTLWKPQLEAQLFTNMKYARILKEVHDLLIDDKFNSGGFVIKRSLCRVCITSLGSPQWYDDNFGEDLIKFLTILRAAIRSSVSVCFITMPMHLVAKYDETLVSKIRNLVDYAIELESFDGSEKATNPAFKEYNGLFQLRKMAAINTLSAYMPETNDLAFKLKRKKFVIEKLHLPPELQDDSTNKAKQDAKATPTLSCGSNLNPNSKFSFEF